MSDVFCTLSVNSDDRGVSEIVLSRLKLLNRFDNQLQIELSAVLEELRGRLRHDGSRTR